MGKVLAELPIEPVIGRLVLLGAVLGALDPILTIAASMGHRDPFVNPPTKRQQADEVEICTYYSGTSDKGPFEIVTTSLQRTLVSTPC